MTILFQNDGYCCVCQADRVFTAYGEWLRDSYVCQICWTTPRARALTYVLNTVAPDWRSSTMHESSPGWDFLGKQCADYSDSFFYEDTPLGSYQEGHRCETLEALTFPDESFDVFVTQDVLEHVFEPERALREIMRVLKDGGVHIFTTPKHPTLAHSVRRASLVDGKVINLAEAQFHGNPIDPEGGSLVTWDYGADFIQLVRGWSGYCTSTYILNDRQLGIDGEYLDIFVTRKNASNRL